MTQKDTEGTVLLCCFCIDVWEVIGIIKKPKIGVVCLARRTFDVAEAERIYSGLRQDLAALDQADFICLPELLFEREDARRAAEILRREGIDGLVCVSGTFHLGSLVLELAHIVQAPLLLWGLKEPPYSGGKIRLNTVCGVNLDASNLYKAGLRNYCSCFGDSIDRDWLAALRASTVMKQARIALIGSRAHSFYNLAYDELDTWRDLGVLVDCHSLHELWDWPVDDEEIKHAENELKEHFATSAISAGQLQLTAQLAAKLRGFSAHHHLDALALRCWPEFAASYGIAPCGAMSLVQAGGVITACEGDVEGALSMLIHRAVGIETPYLADLSQVDFDKGEALLWHCGVAPCNLRDGCSEVSLDSYHAGGKGVTADFVLQEGDISVLRLDSAGRDRRLFYREGKALPMEKELKGTYARARFQEPADEVLQAVIDNGIAHHLSVGYGKCRRALELLARIKQWTFIG